MKVERNADTLTGPHCAAGDIFLIGVRACLPLLYHFGTLITVLASVVPVPLPQHCSRFVSYAVHVCSVGGIIFNLRWKRKERTTATRGGPFLLDPSS